MGVFILFSIIIQPFVNESKNSIIKLDFLFLLGVIFMAMTEQQIMARASDYFDEHADDVLYYEWHGSIFEISCYPKIFEAAKEQYLYDIKNEDLEDIKEVYEADNGDVPEYSKDAIDQLSLFGIGYVFNDTEIHNFIEDIAMEARQQNPLR